MTHFFAKVLQFFKKLKEFSILVLIKHCNSPIICTYIHSLFLGTFITITYINWSVYKEKQMDLVSKWSSRRNKYRMDKWIINLDNSNDCKEKELELLACFIFSQTESFSSSRKVLDPNKKKKSKANKLIPNQRTASALNWNTCWKRNLHFF
jgi:hypothetical protein